MVTSGCVYMQVIEMRTITSVILSATITIVAIYCITGQRGDNRTDPRSYVIHCCSQDLSRTQTEELSTNVNLANGGIQSSDVLLCTLLTLVGGPTGVILAVICGLGVTIGGSFFLNAVTRAAEDNGCLRIQILPLTFSDDHSSYCH